MAGHCGKGGDIVANKTPNNLSTQDSAPRNDRIELKDEHPIESNTEANGISGDKIELKDENKVRKHTWGEEPGGFEVKPESDRDDSRCNKILDSRDDAPVPIQANKTSRRFFKLFGSKSLTSQTHAEHERYILLFDLDGTLLDSIDGIYHSFTHACGVDFSPTLDEVRSLIGLPLNEMFIRVGFSAKEAQNRVILYKNNYRKIYLEKTKLLPNVIESLIMASGFAHLGVVTTKTAQYSKHILQHFDILKFFSVVIGSENVQHPKPSAEPILKALCSLPIAPKEQVFMIGDTIYDLEAAHNAQINGVWVRSGYGVGLESSANASFDNVYDAVKALRAQAKEYDDNWHSL